MAVNRRRFLASAGMSLVAGSLARAPRAAPPESRPPGSDDLQDWSNVRDQFNLSRDYIHLSTFYISSHPRPVREAIDQYRRALDENPFRVVEQGMFDAETEHIPAKVKIAAAAYLGGKPEEIALTGSTTMGLALVYNGLRIKPGQEILTTVHDHYSHHEAESSLRRHRLFRCHRNVSGPSRASPPGPPHHRFHHPLRSLLRARGAEHPEHAD